MTEERWRTVSLALGGLLAVMLGLVAVIVALRPSAPGATASPTTVAVSPSVSPSASVGGSPSVSPSPTLAPTPTEASTPSAPPTPPPPTPTEAPSPSPSPSTVPSPSPTEPATASPSPSPSPTLAPTADQTVVRFPSIGLDSGLIQAARPRLVTFVSDGPGNVRAAVSDVTAGQVELCLWEGTPREQTGDPECIDTADGVLSRRITDAGQHTWTVSVTSSDESFAPTLALTLRFRAVAPTMTVRDFRFQGSLFPEYNGIDVRLDARADGPLAVDASWTGGSQPFRLAIEDVVAQQAVDEVTGEGEGVEHSVELAAASTYGVLIANEAESVEVESLIRARLSWP